MKLHPASNKLIGKEALVILPDFTVMRIPRS